ncbi:diguanylate cyclase [Enterovibrio paralichthyis]|uniref:diguanylate cyclase n=1 Tax=Enterovibrio paralichthyis TaxID=2853805 RepID=UPI001C459452|nr:diguanylate cyclase [Enterovibrio paralichthyis]MBV7299649.1 GGDEF domain-containing protein [Enterovibrio paralichthyis]
MGDYAFFEATRIFKRAVPLMVKYKVPTTPHYFSLWYTYCAQTYPQLNQAVDDTVERYGSCSVAQCDSLIETFLLDDAKKEMDSFRQKLESLAADLGDSMEHTVSDTKEFRDILSSSVTKLETANSNASIGSEGKQVLQELITGSQQLLNTTSQYQLQVSNQRSEIDLLTRQLEEYKKQASHDALTGCLNRREFDKQINDCIEQHTPFSLLLADIDHFKSFNDEYGHQMGDKVLKIVAQKLMQVIGTAGSVFRYGGEEFAVIAPGSSQKSAYLLAEKARVSLERLSVTDKRTGQKINSITASFGVGERCAGEDKNVLITRTDDALYNAKTQGRNRVMPLCR